MPTMSREGRSTYSVHTEPTIVDPKHNGMIRRKMEGMQSVVDLIRDEIRRSGPFSAIYAICAWMHVHIVPTLLPRSICREAVFADMGQFLK